jgi:hypothetical protein
LLRRVFEFDILACADCGGRLRLLATIEDRAVVEKILTHLGLSVDLPITRTTPAASGPTDRTTAVTLTHTARQHWRAARGYARNTP